MPRIALTSEQLQVLEITTSASVRQAIMADALASTGRNIGELFAHDANVSDSWQCQFKLAIDDDVLVDLIDRCGIDARLDVMRGTIRSAMLDALRENLDSDRELSNRYPDRITVYRRY